MALVYQGETPGTIFSERNNSFIRVDAGSSQELLAEAKKAGLNVVEASASLSDSKSATVQEESALVVSEEKPTSNGKK
jgi:hypothetical protein